MKKCGIAVTLAALLIAGFLISGCTKSSESNTIVYPSAPIDLKEPPAGTAYNLTILHTNDVHGQVLPLVNNNRGGLARNAWVNQTIRNENTAAGRYTLILNAGDTRDGSTLNDPTQTADVWKVLNMAGYDATVIGNHDHLEGIRSLYKNMVSAFDINDSANTIVYDQHMKVLYGNINPDRINNFPSLYTTIEARIRDSFENAFVDPIDPSSSDPSKYPSTIDQTRFTPMYDSTSKLFNQKLFVDMGEFVVGIFGAANTETIYTFIAGEPLSLLGNPLPAGVKGEGGIFYDADPLGSNYTNQMIDYLADPNGDGNTSDGANVIICVSHVGISGDLDIARYARGPRTGRRVDVVVGAHTHTQLNKAIEVLHPTEGTKTWVVQAKASGMFVGRIDLNIVDGKPALANSGLIEVNSNIPEDATVKSFIDNEITKSGGVNDWFMTQSPDPDIAPYGVKPSDPVGNSELDFNTVNFAGENPLTNLIANAFLWEGQANSIFDYPATAWESRTGPGFVDFALLIPFVLHGEGVLTNGPLTVESIFDTLHLHDMTPNPSRPDTMNVIGLTPISPITIDLTPDYPVNTTLNNHIEALLEVLYGILDLMDMISSTMPPDEAAQLAGYKSAIQEYLGTLQWAGLSFVVDFSRPPLDRINPSSILINGQPIDPNRVYYFSMNSNIAKFLGAISGLVGGILQSDLIQWDPLWSETNVPEWVALMDYIRYSVPSSDITTDLVGIGGAGLRTVEPDLTLQPWDIQFTPAVPVRGGTVTIHEWIINTGMTGVDDANIDFTFDPTPDTIGDDPDGYTDQQTGFHDIYIGRDHVRDVPPFTDHIGLAYSNGITWTIPTDILPGKYQICPEIRNIVSSLPEYFTGNDGGPGLCATLTIK